MWNGTLILLIMLLFPEKKQTSIPVKESNIAEGGVEKEAETAKKETRRWETWNTASIFGFYEALKEVCM